MLRSSAGNNSLQNDPSKTSVSASKSPSHKAFMGFQLPEEPVEISSSQESTRVISDENTLTNRNKKSRTVRFAASSPNQLGSDFDISDTPRKRNLPQDTGISSGAQTKRQKQILPNIHIPLRPSSTPQSSNSKIQYVSSAQAYNHKSSRERNLAQKKLPIIRIKLNNIQKAEPESLSSSMSPQNLSETSSEINQNSSFSDSIPSPTVKNNIFNDKGKGKGKTKPRLNNNENGSKFVSQSPSGDDGFSEEEEYEEDSSNTGTANSQKTKKFFRIGPGMKRTCQNFHIVDPSGRQVYALIASRIDRGFHMGSAGWLTYRRNYITVSSSFSLTTNTRMEYGKVPQCHLYVCNGDSRLLIRSFALRITAFQIFSEDVLEEIPLIQHTPKRNKGFKKPPAIIPAVPGLLPSHNFIQNNTTCRTMSRRIAVENLFTHPRKGLGTFVEYYPECENINHVVVFERIQFTTPSGGESNKCKLVVQLITTLENGVSYVAAWSETPPFSLRIRSPSSYSDSILHMGRSPSKNNQIKAFVNYSPGQQKSVVKLQNQENSQATEKSSDVNQFRPIAPLIKPKDTASNSIFNPSPSSSSSLTSSFTSNQMTLNPIEISDSDDDNTNNPDNNSVSSNSDITEIQNPGTYSKSSASSHANGTEYHVSVSDSSDDSDEVIIF